jgi:hypothetical protein
MLVEGDWCVDDNIDVCWAVGEVIGAFILGDEIVKDSRYDCKRQEEDERGREAVLGEG